MLPLSVVVVVQVGWRIIKGHMAYDSADQQATQGNPDSNPNVNPQLSAGDPQQGQPEDSSLQLSSQPMSGFVGNAEGRQTGVATGAPQSSQSQQQIPDHPQVSTFQRIFEGIVGGPRLKPIMGADGQPTGEVQAIHPTKGGIAAGILAGALSGMVAGAAAKPNIDAFGNKSYGPSMAAGAEAMQKQQRDQRYKELDMSSEQQKYQYNTLKLNLDRHLIARDARILQDETMQHGIDTDAPILAAMKVSPDAKVIDAGVSEAKLLQYLDPKNADYNKFHITRDSVLIDGKTQVYGPDGKPLMNADGTPHTAWTYTIYDPNSIVQMTKALREKFPQLQNISDGQSLPLRVLADYSNQSISNMSAQGYLNKLTSQTNKAFPDAKMENIDFQSELASHPFLKDLPKVLSTYGGLAPDKMPDVMRKDKVDPQIIGWVSSHFMTGDVTEDAWAAQRKAADEQQKREADQAAKMQEMISGPITKENVTGII